MIDDRSAIRKKLRRNSYNMKIEKMYYNPYVFVPIYTSKYLCWPNIVG